jgi:hypothetical protein
MTIRERLKLKYRLMVFGVMIIPAVSVLWLHSSTPLNHTFRVTVILFADIAVLLLFIASFKCPSCRAGLLKSSRQVLFEAGCCCTCPHCGTNLDQSYERHVGRDRTFPY